MPYCPKCGKEIQADVAFCPYCGQDLRVTPSQLKSVSPSTPSPQTYGHSKSNRTRNIVIGVVVLIVIITIVFALIGSGAGNIFSSSTYTPTRHTVTLLSGSVAVNALSYSYVQFDVPSGATDVTVIGNFVASGGMGNDIKVYIMSSTDFVNWKNGHQASAYYNSGKVTTSNLNLSLPPGQSYYLVFDNSYSIISSKTVSGTITLTYLL
jgi:hypothetical protein